MLVISRSFFVLLGSLGIFLFAFLNKADLLVDGISETGKVVAVSGSSAIIEFQYQEETIQFQTAEGFMTYKLNNIVPVRFLEETPHQAVVFTFFGYWISGIILPILLIAQIMWLAFSTSFVSRRAKFEFEIWKLKLGIRFPE